MASIDVGIHPDAAGIRTRRFNSDGDPFSTLDLETGEGGVTIYVSNRAVLASLQVALTRIRSDMDAAAPVCGCAHAHALCSAYCHASKQAEEIVPGEDLDIPEQAATYGDPEAAAS